MKLPKDPVMLLSVVNTALRDRFSNLSELAEDAETDEEAIKAALQSIGYTYNEKTRRFTAG